MISTQRAGLTFIIVTIFLDMMGLGIVFPILPQLIASFTNGDVSVAAQYYGYFIALFAAMQFLFSPVLGALSDQYGRRPVVLLSLLGAGLDYVLLSFAPTLALLFVGRLIAGITSASLTAANAYIADVSPPEKRAQNFGVIGAAFGLGFIVGPLLGGLLGGLGPRVPFMAAGLLTLLNWLYGFFVLPESLAPENRRPFSWRRANPLGSLGALGRYPLVLNLTATIICTNLAGLALQSTWVLYTNYRFSWTTWEQGLSLAVVGVLAVAVQAGLVRVILPRLGERRVLVFALVNSAVGSVLYGLATQGWMMYAILIGTGLSFLAQPAAQGIISNAVRPDEQGTIQGALTSVLSLSAVIGPLIATAVFSYFTAPEQAFKLPGSAFFLGSALTLLGLILALRTFARFPAPVRSELLIADS
jgi:DHA1 family tetracycline resistance protein-like MFS transporter